MKNKLLLHIFGMKPFKDISLSEAIKQHIIVEKIDMIPKIQKKGKLSQDEFDFHYVLSCKISSVEFKELAIGGKTTLFPMSKDIRFNITVDKEVYLNLIGKTTKISKIKGKK